MFAGSPEEFIGLSGNKKPIKKENILKDYLKDSKAISFWKEGEKDGAIIYATRDIALAVAFIISYPVAFIISYPIEKIIDITKDTLTKVDDVLISKLEKIWMSKK